MLRHSDAETYRKIHDEQDAKAAKYWKPVAIRSEDREALREAAEFLKAFEGCFVKADAILCRLAIVAPPPRFSLIIWGGNWMWFPFGTCFAAISLPCEDPGPA